MNSTAPQPLETATKLEEKVLAIWRRLLKVENLGVTDNFFDAGGHSLLAMTTILEIESQLGLVISLETIFNKPTVRELCESLNEGHERKAATIIPLRPAKSLDNQLFYIQSVSEAAALQNVLSESISIATVTTNSAALLRQRMDRRGARAAIDKISSIYAEAIFAQRPDRPFCLAGHSFGGILAVETGCKLEALGASPAAIFLFDTFLHRSLRRIFYEIAYNKLLQRKFRELIEGHGGELRKRATVLSKNVLSRSFAIYGPRTKSADDLNMIFREVGSHSYHGPALPLSGELVLFLATRTDSGQPRRLSSNLGWARNVRNNLTMVPIPGATHDFHSLLESGAQSFVAREIERRFF
jgi:thioesterase domain-containing protein/acyl carrier protein